MAPLAVYLHIRAGDKARGLALALALRKEPLSLTSTEPTRVCDLVVHRLWLARVVQRPDPEARAAGEDLLDSDHPLGPYRRSLLHYALGADIATRTPLHGLEELDRANEHLNRALAGARSLGQPRPVGRCQSMLAMLEVPRGNLSVAADLCSAALASAPASSDQPAFWQLRALLVAQWTRHYQGLAVDPAVVRTCAERPEVHADPLLSVLLVTVSALAAVEAGDVAAARRELGQARSDRRIDGLGLWRLPKLLLDGYLAVSHDDTRQTERVVEALEELSAPGEVALVRAQHLAHTGRADDALAAIGPVTSGAVRTLSFTYPVALALEAALLETVGRSEEADRSTARALGASEPINGLRLFVLQEPDLQRTLVRRVADAAPRNRWAATVAAYLDQHVDDPADHAYEEPVRTTAAGVVAGPPVVRPQIPTLTRRELEVLRLVNDGASNAQIATQLFVSVNTTKTHLRSIRRKMGVSRTIQAAAIARREGWI